MNTERSIKIILVSSGQPALNPRLVKEADALYDTGYDVTVLYQYWNNWGTQLDTTLLTEKKWKAIRVGGAPGDGIYLFTKIIYKIARVAAKYIGFDGDLAEFAIGRGAWLLSKRAIALPADLYIGHNIGALPAVVRAARKNNVKCGFDAEDFHRNETSNDPSEFDVKIKAYIEDKYLPRLNYLTTASPLISQRYEGLYRSLKPITTILNVFPKHSKIKSEARRQEPLKLFWFSQTIGTDRGIENVIKAMGDFQKNNFELHLLGHHNEKIKDTFNKLALLYNVDVNSIFYYLPIAPDQIMDFSSQFNIGLASELSEPENRNICLTNKIFIYIQTGLVVLASDTKAQTALLSKYSLSGKIYSENDKSLIESLRFYFDNRDELNAASLYNYNLANTVLNWESESAIFLELIKTALKE